MLRFRPKKQKRKWTCDRIKSTQERSNHMSARRTYSPEYKASIVVEILREVNTISEIGARENISPKLLGRSRGIHKKRQFDILPIFYESLRYLKHAANF